MTSTRRPARDQKLSSEEAALLRTLEDADLHLRAKQLYESGWTLRSIGESLDPPRSRSTIRSWITRPYLELISVPLPMPVPPELATPPEYIRKRPRSPGIPPALKDEIAKLEPVARRYRARMPESSAAAKSNRRLTELVVDLYNQDVTITELAAAAGVTYRAMARRLGRI